MIRWLGRIAQVAERRPVVVCAFLVGMALAACGDASPQAPASPPAAVGKIEWRVLTLSTGERIFLAYIDHGRGACLTSELLPPAPAPEAAP